MLFDISVFFLLTSVRSVCYSVFCYVTKIYKKEAEKMINNYSRNRLYTDFPMDSYNIFCPERTHYPILAI